MKLDYDVNQMLTQNNAFTNKKRRNKILKAVKMTQKAQAEYHAEDSLKTCGYIKSVTLKNFMCHENFKINFGRRLNFIIGHNGSGKSAILTAIVVCLGAKASDTNRGTSLKDLIKEGKNSSLIQVVLSNDGVDAYNPGKYGKEILIERHIKRESTGSTPYIIKSESGLKVSSKKAELDAILDNFNIAVNNPMSFLSQDAARSFLTATTDDIKYKHFMAGTMMSEILANLQASKDQLDRMDIKIYQMKDEVLSLKKEAKEAKKLFDELMSTNDLRDTQQHLSAKYFYMEADRATNLLDGIRNARTEYAETIKAIDANIEKINNSVQYYDNQISQVDQKLVALKVEMEEAQKYQIQCKAETDKRVAKAEVAYKELESANKKIKNKEQKIQSLLAEIATEEQRLRQINGDSKELLIEKVNAMDNELAKLKIEVEDQRNEKGMIEGEEKEKFEEISTDADNTREQIRRLRDTIRSMQSQNRQDPLASFPKAFKDVINEMKKVRFDYQPLGPLSAYFSIKNGYEKWGPLLNRAFAGDSTSFIVSSYRDQKLLSEILRKHNCHASVINRKRERFDYSSGLPDTQYPTVLNALSFKDDDVKYALIDLKHIESILLIENRKEAQHVVERGTNNVKSAFSLLNNTSGNNTSIGINGGLRIDPINYDIGSAPKILPESGQQDTSNLIDQIKNLEKELDIIQQRQHQNRDHYANKKRQLNETIKNLDRRIRDTDQNRFKLQRKLDEDSETGKLEGLQEELEESKLELQVYHNSIPDLNAAIERNRNAGNEAHELLESANETFKSIYRMVGEARAKREDIISNKEFDLSKIHSLQTSKEKRERDLQEIISKEPEFEEAIQSNLNEAKQYGSREQADAIEVRSIERLKEMITNISNQLKDVTDRLAKSPEDIVNDDNYARSRFAEAYEQFNQVRSSKALMSRSVYKRFTAFTQARDFICVAADQDFKSSLQFRNFTGNLDFDFKKEKLKMLVSTKNDKKPRHVDSLSGGEKSFSQISLLLATWKPMRSRIRGLDEFDVFMDQVNRRIGMQLMMKKLSEEHNTQTIFITPQDIGQISELDNDLVSIFRMSDPRGNDD